jgi:hypothetical protein
MNISRKGIRYTAALAAAALGGLVLAGCTCCPKPSRTAVPEPVYIHVSFDATKKVPVVRPETARLCIGLNFAEWSLVDLPRGTVLEIRFEPPAPPIEILPRKEEPNVHTSVPPEGTTPGRYKYKATLMFEDRTRVTVDPYIQIDR